MPTALALASMAALLRFIAVVSLAGVLAACGSSGGGPPITISLTATAVSPTQIDLVWSPDPQAGGYDVDRNGEPAYPYHISDTSFSDYGLVPDTRYCYVVYAVAWPLGVVGRSNAVCVRTMATTAATISVIDEISDRETAALALDAAGHAHVSYKSPGLSYATNRSGSWTTAQVDDTAGAYGPTGIAITPGGSVHISYTTYDNDTGARRLKYATNSSGAWNSTVLDVEPQAYANAIALDSAGHVHIAYSLGDDLFYTTDSAGGWAREFVARFSDGPVQAVSIATDTAGRIHIAYAAGSGICTIGYASRTGGAWTEGGIAFAAECDVGLALDSANTPHTTFSTGTELIHATNTIGTWDQEAIDWANWLFLDSASIAIGPGDQVHVAYQDSDLNLKHASNASGEWITEYLDSGDVGSGNAIRVDAAGRGHIIYDDASDYRLKYAVSN